MSRSCSTEPADHPRIRGEHAAVYQLGRHVAGIIPAYAGSTIAAHAAALALWGSSPHTRGALPAQRPCPSATGDHPRIRGEHRSARLARLRQGGIIPAYAGSTVIFCPESACLAGSSPHTRGAPRKRPELKLAFRDHPRIRGEHPPLIKPRMLSSGIIPAYAGSTKLTWSRMEVKAGSSPHTRGAPRRGVCSSITRRDHPRIRGEHFVPSVVLCQRLGIIPAYAGSTLPQSWL